MNKGEITTQELESLGFEQYQRKSREWFYHGIKGIFSAEYGSIRFGEKIYIRTVTDLSLIRELIDMPSDKTRYSTEQEKYI